jgi:hypothetical protein
MIYGSIFWVLAALLAVGFGATLLVRPVADHLLQADDARVAAAVQGQLTARSVDATASAGSSLGLVLAWLAVLVPIAYGITMTVQKALVLFR